MSQSARGTAKRLLSLNLPRSAHLAPALHDDANRAGHRLCGASVPPPVAHDHVRARARQPMHTPVRARCPKSAAFEPLHNRRRCLYAGS